MIQLMLIFSRTCFFISGCDILRLRNLIKMSAANENSARLTQFKNKGKDANVSNTKADIACFLSNTRQFS